MPNPYHDAAGRFASGPKISGTRGMKQTVSINKKIKAVAKSERDIVLSRKASGREIQAAKTQRQHNRAHLNSGKAFAKVYNTNTRTVTKAQKAIEKVYQPRITKTRKSAVAQLRTMNGANKRLSKARNGAPRAIGGVKIKSTRVGKGRGKNRK